MKTILSRAIYLGIPLLAACLILLLFIVPRPASVSFDGFDKIKMGMTKGEVEAILGSADDPWAGSFLGPVDCVDYDDGLKHWRRVRGITIIVGFQRQRGAILKYFLTSKGDVKAYLGRDGAIHEHRTGAFTRKNGEENGNS